MYTQRRPTVQTLEAIREYYCNDDPQSTGSWLLGPLA